MNWYDHLRDKLTEIAGHYEKTAPTVNAWADELYIRMNEKPERVVLAELMMVERLHDRDGWMYPTVAANAVYHLMNRLGQDTTGHTGF